MTDEEIKAIEIVNAIVKVNEDYLKDVEIQMVNQTEIQAMETVLNLIQKQKEEIEKKDKIINSIKEYAQQEIDFATEDIRDYIDDGKESNKNIIGELKEWREHWKDIIRIMNNEKTYMNFEYKVEESKE